MLFSPAALRVPSVLAIALLAAAVCCAGVGSSSQDESPRRGKCASVDPSVPHDGGGGGRGIQQYSECKAAGSGSLYPFGFTMDSGKPIRMAITMPVTSRGHSEGKPISEMRIFTSFLSRDSFQATVVPAGFPLEFNFYIGYDLGDPILDCESQESLLLISPQDPPLFFIFNFPVFCVPRHIISQMLTGLNLNAAIAAEDGRRGFTQAFRDATHQVECSAGSKGGACTTLDLMGFNHTNTLTALWNGLNAKAYMDGCHYIFMPNDDLRMLTKRWPETFITALYDSPMLPNLGVTGPVDPVSGRKDMSSMPCVSRCIFLFPPPVVSSSPSRLSTCFLLSFSPSLPAFFLLFPLSSPLHIHSHLALFLSALPFASFLLCVQARVQPLTQNNNLSPPLFSSHSEPCHPSCDHCQASYGHFWQRQIPSPILQKLVQ